MGLLALPTGCGEGPYLQFEETYTDSSSEMYLGGGCISTEMTGSSSSGVAGGGPTSFESYSIEYRGHGDSITVIVRDGAALELERRDYSERFLRSGDVDEVRVPLADDELHLRYWGTEQCEEIRRPG